MTTGSLAISIVGSYNTIPLAVAAMNGQEFATGGDHFELVIEPGIGGYRYVVLKFENEVLT